MGKRRNRNERRRAEGSQGNMETNQTQQTRHDEKDVAHVMEDIEKAIADFRRLIEAGVDNESLRKHETAIRGAIGKAREHLKTQPPRTPGGERAAQPGEEQATEEQRPEEPSGEEEAMAASQASEALVESGPPVEKLKHVLEGLGKAVESLQAVEDELRSALGPATEKHEGALRRAFGKAHGLVRRKAGKGEEARNEGRRSAGHLQGQEEAEERHVEEEAPEGFETVDLYDSSEDSFRQWKLVGSGSIENRGGALVAKAGNDRGLIYYFSRRFDDFKLTLKFRPDSADCVMSAAVRFLDPKQPVPDRADPSVLFPYDNPAFVSAHTGFEIELGVPGRTRTPAGTIDGVLIGDVPGAQIHRERGEIKPGEWNDLEVEALGNDYVVRLNGKETARLANTDPYRGKPASAGSHAGFVGIVMRSGSASLRDIRAEVRSAEPGK